MGLNNPHDGRNEGRGSASVDAAAPARERQLRERCPACGASLAIDRSGYLICTAIGCPSPTTAHRLIRRDEGGRWLPEFGVCQGYIGHPGKPGPRAVWEGDWTPSSLDYLSGAVGSDPPCPTVRGCGVRDDRSKSAASPTVDPGPVS